MPDERQQRLSFAFMRAHPAQAAQVLEALPGDQAALLFAQAPARLCAAVLAAMLPQRAAACIEQLDDERTLEMLAAMSIQAAVAVLRHLPDARRRSLIAALPTRLGMSSALLLAYADDTLGAWADPDVAAFSSQTTVHKVSERLRQILLTHPIVFVVSEERRLLGVVDVAALLHAPGNATLGSLMTQAPAVLAAHAPLSGALAHAGWDQTSVMPVVEPGDRLVGALTRDALARAIHRFRPPATASTEHGGPSWLVRNYWQALAGLIEVALKLLPGVDPVDGSDRAR